uniref:zinc finger A20 and AN1 domain-containing stress-associated protein 6-like n=1 Tax=Erigeron canadensis TaxID=72917 RepID=UPI001CB93357|nr:zinc finger A20 and AN1 domain-containing stress-associated protein 6-like [Erigeron canadensis]
MAEEQNWEETSNHTPCANNCGFFGSPTTRNLCSKCYNDHCVKEQHMSTAKLAVEKSLFIQPETSPSSSAGSDAISEPVSVNKVAVGNSLHEASVKTQVRNRCGSCKKRVGLTGFTCKCGTMFCGTHRYPEKHGCTFDFKTVGKEAIAKANPVIKAEKLNKI